MKQKQEMGIVERDPICAENTPLTKDYAGNKSDDKLHEDVKVRNSCSWS